MNAPSHRTIELLEARMKDNPKSLVFARLADLYLEEGRIDEAIALCNESAKVHSYYVTGHFILAKAYIAKKDLEKAEIALKKVLSHDQQYPAAHKLLGDILCKTNRNSLAVAHYEDILHMDPLEEKVQKSLDRIPKEAAIRPPEPALPPKKTEPKAGPQAESVAGRIDDSWMDQIKEFRPGDTGRPPVRAEDQISGDEIRDPFAGLPAFHSLEKEVSPETETGTVQKDTSTSPAEAAGEKPAGLSEPLIGETASNFSGKEVEIRIPHASSEIHLEEIPGLIRDEPVNPSPDLPISSQAKPTELFPTSEETAAPKEGAAMDASESHVFFNEPGYLDEATLASEPTVLDDTTRTKETATKPPNDEIEPDLDSLAIEPSVLDEMHSVNETKPSREDIGSDFASLFPEPASSAISKPAEPPPAKTDSATPPVPEPEEKKMPKIVTPTLGEIYAAQGQYEKAVKVYETLLEKNPGEKKYLDKLEEMRKKLRESTRQ